MDSGAFMKGFFDEMEKQAALPLIPLALRAATLIPKAVQVARTAGTLLRGSKMLSAGSRLLGRGYLGKANLLSDSANIIKSRSQQQQQTTPQAAEPGSIITP